MGFLRRIFGGSGSEEGSGGTDTAWHFYVKSKYKPNWELRELEEV